MKLKQPTILLALWFALALPFFAAAAEKSLVVIHTNDFHGHITEENESAGAARIAAFVQNARATNEGVLVLNAGDAISGTPVSSMFKGAPIFEVLNMVGYDAAALGNHEFDHGYERIEKFREIANYPLLSANAFSPTGDLIADAPVLIKEVNGITVAMIGLITDYTPYMITPTGNEGISFAPPMYTLAATVRAVRPHVDLVIALSHVGHSEEVQLAKTIPGIDLVVGGHSHTYVEPAVKVGNSYIVQANYYGKHVGYIDMLVDTDKGGITEFKGRLVPAAELPPPLPEVQALVDKWEARVAELVDVEIARVDRPYTQIELRPIWQHILAQAAGTELGYYNMGGIRDKIRAGSISARNIWNIEPFGNSLATLTASGKLLKQALASEAPNHEWLTTLDDDTTYTIATNSFVASQAKRVHPDDVVVSDKGVLVRDIIIDYIRDNGLAIK